ncbi:MAG: DUF6768 family protein [Puniceicoccaceae bacterium]
MNNLDERIRAALESNGTSGNVNLSIAEELLQTFRGQSRWMNSVAAVMSLLVFGLWIWTSLCFIQTEDLGLKLEWGMASLFCLLFISFMKVWFWMIMHSNRVMREVKRVELLLAKLLP